MKNRNYIAFAKGLIWFFAVSHIFGYLISSLQTLMIIKEIRKAQKKAAGAKKKNDTN